VGLSAGNVKHGDIGNAKREQLKYYQHTGKVIVVIDEGDIDRLYNGENFYHMLLRKYEEARMDIKTIAGNPSI
jgi:hypothetical protein